MPTYASVPDPLVGPALEYSPWILNPTSLAETSCLTHMNLLLLKWCNNGSWSRLLKFTGNQGKERRKLLWWGFPRLRTLSARSSQPLTWPTHHTHHILSYLPSQPTYHYLSFNNIIIRVLLLAVQFFTLLILGSFFFSLKTQDFASLSTGIKLCWQGIQPCFGIQVHKNFLI